MVIFIYLHPIILFIGVSIYNNTHYSARRTRPFINRPEVVDLIYYFISFIYRINILNFILLLSSLKSDGLVFNYKRLGNHVNNSRLEF